MIDAIKQLSQRPRMPRLSKAPLLTALLSLYVQQHAVQPDASTETEMKDFNSEVQAAVRDSLFSTASPVAITRAPGRLDLMGVRPALPVASLIF
jgi:hypothetical protein